ncbi:MAG: DUF3575 domain-containing protein [Porphyromonadaceae bacterium]|nr:DUF3575 domain-containing protein [Porphyromonadaceae bacterium]
MKKYLFALISLLGLWSYGGDLKAQTYAVRSDIISNLSGNFNLEVSSSISSHLSVHLPLFVRPVNLGLPYSIGLYNLRNNYGYRSREIPLFESIATDQAIGIQPGVRYWTLLANNYGLFMGAFGIGELFKHGGFEDYPYYIQGYSVGAGASIGYAKVVTPNWNFELELGLGVVGRFYDRRDVRTDRILNHNRDLTWALARFGVNLVYLL